jgi:predicted Rdx family selenoprotein
MIGILIFLCFSVIITAALNCSDVLKASSLAQTALADFAQRIEKSLLPNVALLLDSRALRIWSAD